MPSACLDILSSEEEVGTRKRNGEVNRLVVGVNRNVVLSVVANARIES